MFVNDTHADDFAGTMFGSKYEPKTTGGFGKKLTGFF